MLPLSPSIARQWDRLTLITVGIAGLLGVAFALLMPPFQFNDEHGHFARAYQISRGEVIGHRDPQLPAGVLSALLRYPEGYARKSAPRTKTADLFAGAGEASTPVAIGNIRDLNYMSWGNLAYQVYWPVCYLPASAGIRAARFFNLSPVAMLYAGRLMNVLSLLAALATALALAPGYRALITGLALMPMTLQQAAAVSADSLTIGFALVGFALVLRTREHPVNRRYLAIVLVYVPMWVMCKNSIWALPLLLLIPRAQFRGALERAAFISAAALIAAAGLLLWRAGTYDAFAQFTAAGRSAGIDMGANARLFALHPVSILRDVIVVPSWRRYFSNLVHQFVGTFGWWFNRLPFARSYLVLLVAVGFVERNPKPFQTTERAILILVFAGALIQTYLMLFVIDGLYRDGHYGFWSAGVQGRYLIPYSLAGLLGLKQNALTVSSRRLAPLVLCAATAYGFLSLFLIARFFYA